MAHFLAFHARWSVFGPWGDTGGDNRPLKAASRAPGRPVLLRCSVGVCGIEQGVAFHASTIHKIVGNDLHHGFCKDVPRHS